MAKKEQRRWRDKGRRRRYCSSNGEMKEREVPDAAEWYMSHYKYILHSIFLLLIRLFFTGIDIEQ